jgi:hypothetical protein
MNATIVYTLSLDRLFIFELAKANETITNIIQIIITE